MEIVTVCEFPLVYPHYENGDGGRGEGGGQSVPLYPPPPFLDLPSPLLSSYRPPHRNTKYTQGRRLYSCPMARVINCLIHKNRPGSCVMMSSHCVCVCGVCVCACVRVCVRVCRRMCV